MASGMYPSSPAMDAIGGGGAPVGLSHQDAMDRFNAIIKELDAVLPQMPASALSTPSSTPDLRVPVRQILFIAAESTDRVRTPLLISQKIVQLLYKTNVQLARDIYVMLLDQLCHAFDEVAKEAITWLIYADDEVGLFSRISSHFRS